MQRNSPPATPNEPITYCLIAPGCVTGPCESVESVALQIALSMPAGTEVVPLYRIAPSAVAVATMTMGGAEKSDIPARVSRVCPTSAPERQETPSPANLANKIEKLAAEATPGPWAWDQRGEKVNEWALGTAFDARENPLAGHFTDENADYDEYVCSHEAATCNYGDPELICALRNNLPAIIAALRSVPSTEIGTSPHPAPNASEPMVPTGEYREIHLGGSVAPSSIGGKTLDEYDTPVCDKWKISTGFGPLETGVYLEIHRARELERMLGAMTDARDYEKAAHQRTRDYYEARLAQSATTGISPQAAETLRLALLARQQFEGDHEGALSEMEFRVRSLLPTSISSRESTSDAKDAARYRFLQRTPCGNTAGGKGSDEECYLSLNPRDMDAAIDSAIDAATSTGAK